MTVLHLLSALEAQRLTGLQNMIFVTRDGKQIELADIKQVSLHIEGKDGEDES